MKAGTPRSPSSPALAQKIVDGFFHGVWRMGQHLAYLGMAAATVDLFHQRR
jgi:hypothetical protein